MALTRECFEPWYFRIIHAGGLICPCCAMNDSDYGDFILDYIIPKSKGKQHDDIFNNDAVNELKKGLLTGNLRPMCQNCAIAPKRLITTDEFQRKLENKFIRWGIDYTGFSDYSKVDVIKRAGIGLTNRCNLRCIYCNQSVLAEKNPYFKMDFPENSMMDCLDMLVNKGVTLIETGVFGEVTLHPKWCEIFTEFHNKYPDIELSLTTNLCKKYTHDEIQLLAEHKYLRVSIDTLDPELFGRIRVNGKLGVVLDNLDRLEKAIDMKGYERNRIQISSVICNLTWKSIEEVSNYAFNHGYAYSANNLELRPNSTGAYDGVLKPIEDLSSEVKDQIKKILEQVENKAKEFDGRFSSNAGIIERAIANYNKFEPYNDNPVYKQFKETFIHGNPNMFLGIEYDYFNNQYEGIVMKRGETLPLKLNSKYDTIIVREVHVYKKGTCSSKYNQRVQPDYRKMIKVSNDFLYQPNFKEENIEYVLLQVLDWWKEGEN